MPTSVLASWVSLIVVQLGPTPPSAVYPRPLPADTAAAMAAPLSFEPRYGEIMLADGRPLLTEESLAELAAELAAGALAMSEGRYEQARQHYAGLGLGRAPPEGVRAWRAARERIAVALGEAVVTAGSVNPNFPSLAGLPARRGRPAEPPAPRLTLLDATAQRAELLAEMVRFGVTPVHDPPTRRELERYVRRVAEAAPAETRAEEVAGAIMRAVRGSFVHYRNAGGADIDFGPNWPRRYLLLAPDSGVLTSGDPPRPLVLRDWVELQAYRAALPDATVVPIVSRVPDGTASDPWSDVIAPARRSIGGLYEADCESLARVAATLYEALADQGFVLLGFVLANGGASTGHASAVARAPDGSVWLSSNDELHPVEDEDGWVTHEEIIAAAEELIAAVYHLPKAVPVEDVFRISTGVGADALEAARQAQEIDLLNDPKVRHRYGLPPTPLPRFSGS